MTDKRHRIAHDFKQGFAAGAICGERLLSESDDWLLGYDAAYGSKEINDLRNAMVNEHLALLGLEPFRVENAPSVASH